MRCLIFFWFLSCMTQVTLAQPQDESRDIRWQVQQHDSAASFRGVDVTSDGQVAWVSGSDGTVLRSEDRGKTWSDVSPPAADKFDFRDIHGFPDGDQAVAMAVGSPARIYRATQQGRNWELVYEDTRPEIFLDAMAFWTDLEGIAFGDPIDGKVVILRTHDGGKSWTEIPRDKQPKSLAGEGGFAASGTCLCLVGEQTVLIGLGGARQSNDPSAARILISRDRGSTWQATTAPLKAGAASGIFSIAFADNKQGVAVGGTYDQPEITTDNFAITADGGTTWNRPTSTPRGYRSCVFVVPSPSESAPVRYIALGKTGSDYSVDLGKTWKSLSDQGFYAASASDSGGTVIAVGSEGRIGVLPAQDLPSN
ncbi:MAG: hypothetical protein P8I27_14470 [Pirellulaceae bacterium]|nr:hypothetical protein [Pirellulaceae bacterium]